LQGKNGGRAVADLQVLELKMDIAAKGWPLRSRAIHGLGRIASGHVGQVSQGEGQGSPKAISRPLSFLTRPH
jgi:hypothetical protein